jgi:hypothetical protein
VAILGLLLRSIIGGVMLFFLLVILASQLTLPVAIYVNVEIVFFSRHGWKARNIGLNE